MAQNRSPPPHFNPLPPCGGRLKSQNRKKILRNFNPLPPCGGRPVINTESASHGKYFNPLPPCGGRHVICQKQRIAHIFQSTPSVWRETANARKAVAKARISIHSLRVEGDDEKNTANMNQDNFNPLPPCGGRHISPGNSLICSNFNPLPPCGGRLTPPSFGSLYFWISIHSLRVEGDGQFAQ